MAYGGNLHVSKVLSNVAVEYKNNAYIADEILGAVPVQKENDLYYTFVRDFRVPEARRANRAAANMITWGVSTSSYTLQEYALSDLISERDRQGSDSINLDMQTTEFLMDKIMLHYEVDTQKLLFTTGSWSGNATLVSTTSWRVNTTGSTPVQNMLSATSYIVTNSGRRPNTLVLGYVTFDALKLNTDITNRIQYVERAFATKEVLASVFDVGTIYVGESVSDTGVAPLTESLGYVWGPDALLAYFESSPGMKKLSAAYTFQMQDVKTKKWREEKLNGDMIEVSCMKTPRLVATNCAYFFKSAAI